MLFVNFTILDLTTNQVLSDIRVGIQHITTAYALLDVRVSIVYYNSICSVRRLGKHSILQSICSVRSLGKHIAYNNSTCSVRHLGKHSILQQHMLCQTFGEAQHITTAYALSNVWVSMAYYNIYALSDVWVSIMKKYHKILVPEGIYIYPILASKPCNQTNNWPPVKTYI